MPKKAPPPVDPVVITLRLPPATGIRKAGTIIAKQGDHATLYEFEYTDMSGIFAAIQQASTDLSTIKRDAQTRAATAAAAAKAEKAAAAANNPAPASEDDAE